MTWGWSVRSCGHHGPYYASSKPKKNWGKSETFHWKCMECHNVQSGSECKGCRKKYWEVKWEKHEGGRHGKPNGPADQKSAHSDPHVALHQLIHTLLNPAIGAPAPDPNTVALATQLQKQLMVDASLSCKHQRLRSILDKIDYQKKEAQRKQEQVDYMRTQIETLEKELDNHTSQITASVRCSARVSRRWKHRTSAMYREKNQHMPSSKVHSPLGGYRNRSQWPRTSV